MWSAATTPCLPARTRPLSHFQHYTPSQSITSDCEVDVCGQANGISHESPGTIPVVRAYTTHVGCRAVPHEGGGSSDALRGIGAYRVLEEGGPFFVLFARPRNNVIGTAASPVCTSNIVANVALQGKVKKHC